VNSAGTFAARRLTFSGWLCPDWQAGRLAGRSTFDYNAGAGFIKNEAET
jgi:hypothetical protein